LASGLVSNLFTRDEQVSYTFLELETKKWLDNVVILSPNRSDFLFLRFNISKIIYYYCERTRKYKN
jgi:hypothetical protein